MVTNQDVAKLAGVSVATVSRAFKNDGRITPETRAKVLAAAKRLGYYPAFSAQTLKGHRSHIIGLLLPDYHNIFYTTLTELLEKRFREGGYRLMIGFTEESTEIERYYLESFISSRVDAILFTSPLTNANSDIINKLKDYNISALQILRRIHDGIDSLLIDDQYGTREVIKYLIAKGHRRIMFIECNESKDTSPKFEGYQSALQECGIEPSEDMICILPPSIDVTSALTYLISVNRPTALFSSNSSIHLAALRACSKLGLSIPEDISFVAYDDNDWLDYMQIDTVAHSVEDISNKAYSMIIRQLKDSEKKNRKAQTVLMNPYFYMRNSTKSLNADPHKDT